MRSAGVDAIEARLGWLQLDDDEVQTPGIVDVEIVDVEMIDAEMADVEMADVEMTDVETLDVEMLDVEMVDVEMLDVEMIDAPNDQNHTISLESTSSRITDTGRGCRVFATGMGPFHGEIDKLHLSLGL
ncbi:hypothetical protein FPOAC2_11871 [Fusarium poae]